MKNVKSISIRFIGLFIIVIIMNYVYDAFFFEKDIQKHSPIINLVRSLPKKTDILYVGESSNITCSVADADKRSISSMIGDYYPNLNVADITNPASHAGIYKTLLKNVSAEVKTVVVTLNLRSFSVEWMNSNLETSLQKSMVLLGGGPSLWKRFRLSFKDYPIRTEKEIFKDVHAGWANSHLTFPYDFQYKTTLDWKNAIESNSKYDSITQDLISSYVETYAFQIDISTSERIKDLNEIVALAKERNWNLVFNLLGENIEKAEELCGKELVFLMNQNRVKLIDYYTKKGVKVIDNLNAIKNDYFIDQRWPTEHYSDEGRRIIAENVASEISRYHRDKYDSKPVLSVPTHYFFNDCENNYKWGITGELTNDEFYSGSTSSITNKDHLYSLSFDHPLSAIPDSVKNTVKISLMVKGSTFEKTKLVLDIRGENINNQWQAVAIEKLTNSTRDWQECSYTFTLPKEVNNAETIHLYLLNESGKEIYIDDIAIDFK